MVCKGAIFESRNTSMFGKRWVTCVAPTTEVGTYIIPLGIETFNVSLVIVKGVGLYMVIVKGFAAPQIVNWDGTMLVMVTILPWL